MDYLCHAAAALHTSSRRRGGALHLPSIETRRLERGFQLDAELNDRRERKHGGGLDERPERLLNRRGSRGPLDKRGRQPARGSDVPSQDV
ncbi:MAG: hypothetical protein OXG37_11430 [Actinomycetia bacterium]|nr:hypothetical protein [Actinomycetes bacterium]